MINCCVSGDTRIVTNTGLGRAEDLYNIGTGVTVGISEHIAKEFKSNIKKESSSVFKVGEEQLFEVTTKEGYSVEVTPSHKFYLESDEWRKAKNLTEGDVVRLLDHQGLFGPHGTHEEGILQGLIAESTAESFESSNIELAFDNITPSSSVEVTQLYEWASAMSRKTDTDINMSSLSVNKLGEVIDQSPLDRENVIHSVPDVVFSGSKDIVRGFLQAVFELKGEINNPSDEHMYLELYSENQYYLKDIQLLLLNFGVKSILSQTDEEFKLTISESNIVMYKENIGFIGTGSYKVDRFDSCYDEQKEELKEMEENYLAEISEVNHIGSGIAYSLVEPVTYSYIANGFVSRPTFPDN